MDRSEILISAFIGSENMHVFFLASSDHPCLATTLKTVFNTYYYIVSFVHNSSYMSMDRSDILYNAYMGSEHMHVNF